MICRQWQTCSAPELAGPRWSSPGRDIVGLYLDPLSAIAQPHRQHRHQEFIRFLKLIDDAVPEYLDCHPRCRLHFTPTARSGGLTPASGPLSG